MSRKEMSPPPTPPTPGSEDNITILFVGMWRPPARARVRLHSLECILRCAVAAASGCVTYEGGRATHIRQGRCSILKGKHETYSGPNGPLASGV